VLSALADGWRLAAGYNPLFALVGAVIAAMLLARDPGPLRVVLAATALGTAWLLGDGLAIASHAEALGAGASFADWAVVAFWALAGFGLGYALPTWGGVFVGRRVTFGTGWLSAGVVAATVSGAISVIAGRLG